MRKIRILLMSLAVIAAVSTALAGKPDPFCDDYPQYYVTAYGYAPAGDFGINYFCWDGAGVCTYYRPDPFNHPNTYLPCKPGQFQLIYWGNKSEGRSKPSH